MTLMCFRPFVGLFMSCLCGFVAQGDLYFGSDDITVQSLIVIISPSPQAGAGREEERREGRRRRGEEEEEEGVRSARRLGWRALQREQLVRNGKYSPHFLIHKPFPTL